MKENLEIFKIVLKKSSINIFLVFSLWINKNMQLLQLHILQLWPPTLYLYAISKRIKLGQPARSHLKDLSQSFKTVMDFAMFFSLDDYETLTNILFRFFFVLLLCLLLLRRYLMRYKKNHLWLIYLRLVTLKHMFSSFVSFFLLTFFLFLLSLQYVCSELTRKNFS